jgi:hypothetical protein
MVRSYELPANPKLEDHPLSAADDCLFSIFASILYSIFGGIVLLMT